MTTSVRVPPGLVPVFEQAEEYVRRYFALQRAIPEQGRIEISGERYILVRAASMSIEFFELIRALYQDRGAEAAQDVAQGLLFDIAHSLGKADARAFAARMQVTDPIEMLSAGPVHFAHAGWAFVDIKPESVPTPDEEYLLVYDHPYSFEADAWIARGARSGFPVCVMNAGYSSGWCEECFGLPLVAVELTCRAMGHEHCRFIMAPPQRIEGHLARGAPASIGVAPAARRERKVPEFFERKRLEEELHQHRDRLEELVHRRTAELVEANRKLRESEQRFRRLVEADPDAVVVLDVDAGRFIHANEHAARLYDLPLEDLLLLGPVQLSPACQPDGRPSAEKAMEKIDLALRGDIVFFEWLHRSAGGREFPAEVHLVRLPAAGRKLVRGNVRDISGRKQAEQARIEFERGLLQSQKLESLGLLAGGVAHDFSNLLVPMLGSASLLLRNPALPSALRGQVELIERAAGRARDLIRQLLAYSGRGQLQVAAVDLDRLIEEMGGLLRLSISKKAELLLEFSGALPPIRADAGQLTQVVMNLVLNASEALGEGGGRITLSTRPVDEGVLLRVSDTGCGLSPEARRRMFEPFFTTKFTGRGLGLAAVEGIVRAHGGRIDVESVEGAGTTFSVQLPRGEAVEAAAGPALEVDWSGSGLVLVIDDEPDARRTVGAMLEGLGCRAIFAGDGRRGLELFALRRAELACTLLDLTMPELGGGEVLREIRSIDPAAPVVLISGYSEEEAVAQAPGPTAFLQKPFTVEQLAAVLAVSLQPPAGEQG